MKLRSRAHLPGVRLPADFLGLSRVCVDADPAELGRPGNRVRLVVEVEDGRGGWRQDYWGEADGPDLVASLGGRPWWVQVPPGARHGRPSHDHAGKLVRARLLTSKPVRAVLRHEAIR